MKKVEALMDRKVDILTKFYDILLDDDIPRPVKISKINRMVKRALLEEKLSRMKTVKLESLD